MRTDFPYTAFPRGCPIVGSTRCSQRFATFLSMPVRRCGPHTRAIAQRAVSVRKSASTMCCRLPRGRVPLLAPVFTVAQSLVWTPLTPRTASSCISLLAYSTALPLLLCRLARLHSRSRLHEVSRGYITHFPFMLTVITIPTPPSSFCTLPLRTLGPYVL